MSYKAVVELFLLVVFAVLAQSVAVMATFNSSFLFPVRLVAGDRSTITGVTPLLTQHTLVRGSVFAVVIGCFSRIQKLLGRTETRTRDMICFQAIRTV